MSTVSQAASRQGLATITQAMAFLSMSRSSIYKLMESGRLTYCRIGGARRIPWASLERLVQDSTVGA